MSRLQRRLLLGACASALVGTLASCGGSGSSASAPPLTVIPPPEVVQGIATPSTVSVVTATNAG